MKYKVLQHSGPNDSLEQAIIETDEDYNRLMAHAHIHSAEPIIEGINAYVKDEPVGYTKPQTKSEKKIKK